MKEAELKRYNERKKQMLADAMEEQEWQETDIASMVCAYRRRMRVILAIFIAVWAAMIFAFVGKLEQHPARAYATTQDGRVIAIHPNRVVEK